MPNVNKSALVNYSSDEMYQLVSNIDDYQKFLPWCGGSKIVKAEDDFVEATVEIAHGSLKKSFTTHNVNTPGEKIAMSLVDGPFKSLDGNWYFQPLGESGCKVSLDLNFEFSNRLVAMAIGKVFNNIAGSLVDSFAKRAVEVYGKR
ncbi:MAG: type II toxin-antitoxin system RatA family toxin [Gammaproteobacteria bacterium]|nr:type II toxin-antitoxin system RatA family toxin [Gammaproteobacteria bacterium]